MIQSFGQENILMIQNVNIFTFFIEILKLIDYDSK